jgi:pyruvate formate lyase activating enzyme
LICGICPHDCKISLGAVGRCSVIRNIGSTLENIYEGHCSNIALEPIEKRPFYHILPGSRFLSVGFFGCNISCEFCQNFTVSQQVKGSSKFYSVKELVELAQDRNADGIAFTYNEPTIYHNYIEEVGNEIGRRNLPLKLVIKTNGFVRPSIIRNLCLYADAINVDLKGDDNDYKEVCGGWLDPVLTCIEWILRMDVHLEISYLVLPSKIDNSAFNIYFRNWLADLDPYIPLHLLYFYPFHRMNVPSYKPSRLLSLMNMFLEKMEYVYIANHFGDGLAEFRDTTCRDCGLSLITRQRSVCVRSLRCCGNSLSGVF